MTTIEHKVMLRLKLRKQSTAALEKFAAAWKVRLSHNTKKLYAYDQEACDHVLLGKLRYL